MRGEDEHDITWLRRQLIAAIASDPVLVKLLVLKGGNALNLVHEIGERASVDLDYSLAGGFDDTNAIAERLFRSIRLRLEPHGLTLFDARFGPRPKSSATAMWGGYSGEFKIARIELATNLSEDVDMLRRLAVPVTPGGQSNRVFRVEISKYEHCDAKEAIEVEGVTCWVYTLPMIVAEKLRALCQQMEEGGRRHPSARARDFYDIWSVINATGLDLAREENRTLLETVFAAKSVPLKLLALLEGEREFHRVDWPAVEAAVGAGELRGFDFYFDFVLGQVQRLEALGVIDPPGPV